MAQHIFTGSGAPTTVPSRVGQHYIDLTNKITYVSAGTASSSDWRISDATAAVSAHVLQPDPHPQYETSAEAQAKVDAHANLTNNPHATTKTQVGLGNVDNTSDLSKPVSTLQAAADAAVQAFAIQRANHSGTQLAATISDFSSAVNSIINAIKGVANGLVPLDGTVKIPAVYLPAFVDDVLEFANLASFPATGESGKIYVDLATNKTYRWSGSVYSEISASPGSTDAVSEGATNLYFTAARVLSTALTGISFLTGTAVVATDTVLVAIGKLQKQISDIVSNFQSNVRSTVLTGLALIDSAIVATDTVLVAIGKIQGQLNQRVSDFNATLAGIQAQLDVWTELVTSADIITSSGTTLSSVSELSFPVVAGRKYYIECTAIFRSANTNTGIALTVGTTNSATGTLAMQVNIPVAADGTAAAYTGNISSLGDLVIGTGVQTVQPTWFIANMKGVFVCTASGDLVPQFRSENNGTNVNFGTGSVILVREFA